MMRYPLIRICWRLSGAIGILFCTLWAADPLVIDSDFGVHGNLKVDGKLGVGVSPESKVHIKGSGDLIPLVVWRSEDSLMDWKIRVGSIADYLDFASDSSTPLRVFKDGDLRFVSIDQIIESWLTDPEGNVRLTVPGFDSASGNIIMRSYSSSDGMQNHLFVEGQSGNVGIGISEPSERLDVDGNLAVTGKIIVKPKGEIPLFNSHNPWGDGTDAVVWQNQDTSRVILWEYDGWWTRKQISVFPEDPARTTAGMRLVGRFDMDCDSVPDYLWTRPSSSGSHPVVEIWYMESVTNVRNKATYEFPEIQSDLWLFGVGFCDTSDRFPALYWQHLESGAVSVTRMDETSSFNSTPFVLVEGNSTFRVRAVGDIDRDGVADLVWQNLPPPNNAKMRVDIWLMNSLSSGSQYRKALVRLSSVPFPWELRGLADFDRDGILDLIWFNSDPSIRKGVCWLLDDSQKPKETRTFASRPSPGFEIVPTWAFSPSPPSP